MYCYKDYLDAIARLYQERKNKGNLPQKLLQPSPGKLREVCVSVYTSRFLKKDLDMLNSFFEVYVETDLLKTIKKFDLGKFKPLVNYLNGDTVTPVDKNIELLGWILNFSKRPFDAQYNYEAHEEPLLKDDIKDIEEGMTGEHDTVNHTDIPESGKTPDRSDSEGRKNVSIIKKIFDQMQEWKSAVGIIILLGIGAAVYFSNGKNTGFGIVSPGQNECMIWADDHYEPVSCDSPARVGQVLPLDKNRLNNLHRIKQPDTITERYIGSLWYQKRGWDSLDYYTAGGMDPNDPDRDLNRLSKHIFDKYLRKKVQ